MFSTLKGFLIGAGSSVVGMALRFWRRVKWGRKPLPLALWSRPDPFITAGLPQSFAHDARNALSVLLNCTYLLRNDVRRDRAPDAQVVELIEAEVRCLCRLFGGTWLDGEALACEELNLADAIRGAFREAAPGPGSSLTLQFDRSSYALWADAGQLRRLLRNLLGGVGGAADIRVNASRADGEDVITIRDNRPRALSDDGGPNGGRGGDDAQVPRRIVRAHQGHLEFLDLSWGSAVRIFLPAKPRP